MSRRTKTSRYLRSSVPRASASLCRLLALQRLKEGISRQSANSRSAIVSSLVVAVVDAFHDYGSFPSSPHQRLVHCDLNQPRAETGLRAKLPNIGKRLQYRFLRHIFRIGLVPQNRQRRGVYPALIGLN